MEDFEDEELDEPTSHQSILFVVDASAGDRNNSECLLAIAEMLRRAIRDGNTSAGLLIYASRISANALDSPNIHSVFSVNLVELAMITTVESMIKSTTFLTKICSLIRLEMMLRCEITRLRTSSGMHQRCWPNLKRIVAKVCF